jgi:hypothetical protein
VFIEVRDKEGEHGLEGGVGVEPVVEEDLEAVTL